MTRRCRVSYANVYPKLILSYWSAFWYRSGSTLCKKHRLLPLTVSSEIVTVHSLGYSGKSRQWCSQTITFPCFPRCSLAFSASDLPPILPFLQCGPLLLSLPLKQLVLAICEIHIYYNSSQFIECMCLCVRERECVHTQGRSTIKTLAVLQFGCR